MAMVTHLLNGVRGALIGIAEVIPGISGGTVALITGVYERLITSAGHVLSGLRLAASDLPRRRGWSRAAAEFQRAHWGLVIAVLVGMFAALIVGARFIGPLVEEYRQQTFAVFFGLVLASLWVPYTHSGRGWRPAHWLLAAVAAVGAFLLTGLPSTQVEAGPIVVGAAAAVAVCALVLPGLSGSFLLQTMGLYEPTLAAVNERDLAYIGVFALGAVVGLAFFTKLLQWLLERHGRITLVVITGLMAGALRALWPWQDLHEGADPSEAIAPAAALPPTLALIAAGFLLVVVILAVERRLQPSGGQDEAASRAQHQAPEHFARFDGEAVDPREGRAPRDGRV
ncbi:MAG: DUF368 domain-containing protein [Nocardiopsaceae bacterium]|nr:DUF368 domain-containing protein [Nocardiopsaceae bacterium]